MSQPEKSIGICLYKLPAKEEAVLKRVITFSGSQGRNYSLAELQTAQLLIVSDETHVDFDQVNPAGSLIVRIADQDNDQPYDVLMARPLLVTKVMRTLDEARKLLLETFATAGPEVASVPVVDSVVEEQPEPPAELVAVRQESTESTAGVEDIDPPVAEAEASSVEVEAEVEAPPAEVETVPVAGQVEAQADVPPVEAEAVAPPVEAEVEATPAEPEAEPAAGPVLAAGHHHLALVVDDSAAIRKQLEIELRDAGITADFAESGEQAMEKVAAYKYDLIFLDIIMPGIDGYETCRQMRMRREMKKTPIIMLSAKTSPLDEVQGVIAGASTYLTKPVRSDQLQKTLKRVSMWLDNFQAGR